MTPLSSGDKLGPYEILSPIGEGGMGEVWKARDTRLDRIVAIKVSKQEFSERFEREARAVAALNHPHICTLHDVGPNYLVFEYVEGEPLKGPLPLDKALEYAAQICDALDAAHSKKITHRDLKPANILVTRQGVKLLDFGLAKIDKPIEVAEETVTIGLTMKGQILGTVQYMSPEQINGREADTRSDIFSFGLVLYEMLTGRRAFEGPTAASVMAAILERPAPSIADVAPANLDRVLKKCLAKEPDDRWQSARDLKAALELAHAPSQPAPASRVNRPMLWYAAVGVLAVAVGFALSAWMSGTRGSNRPPASFLLSVVPDENSPLTSPGAMSATPNISPDGAFLMYTSSVAGRGSRAQIRRLDSLNPAAVPTPFAAGGGGGGVWGLPPDSQFLYFSQRVLELQRVRLPDGIPEVMTPIPGPLRGISANVKGEVLLCSLLGAGVVRMFHWRPGTPGLKELTVPGIPEGGYHGVEFLPDGEHFLFALQTAGSPTADVYVSSLRDGVASTASLLMRNDTAAHFTPAGGGQLLFVRENKLYSRRLDTSSWKLEPDAEQIADHVASAPAFFMAHFSVSRNGIVAWRPGTAATAQVTEFDRKGTPIRTAGPAVPALDSLRLSPDETRLLELSSLVEPGRPGRQTLESDIAWLAWAEGGSRLVGSRGKEIWSRPLNGNEPPRREGEFETFALGGLQDVSPDGKIALHSADNEVRALPLGPSGQGRQSTVVAKANETIWTPRFSPDGHWIVYYLRDSGGIYVQPFPGPGLRRQITGTGTFPVWRADGKEIVYLDQGRIWSIPVQTTGSDVRFGDPARLFEVRPPASIVSGLNPLAVSRDGTRIYFPQATEQPGSNTIHVRSGIWK